LKTIVEATMTGIGVTCSAVRQRTVTSMNDDRERVGENKTEM
jgi:hypothetical protein